MSSYIENYFNTGELVESSTCERCFSKGLAQKGTLLENVKNTQFITIILIRAENDHRGRAIIKTSDVTAVENVKLIDNNHCEAIFEPICIVQHQGVLGSDGTSSGHYTADVKVQKSSKWYRTSDNEFPVHVNQSEVTKRGYVFLYKNITFSESTTDSC